VLCLRAIAADGTTACWQGDGLPTGCRNDEKVTKPEAGLTHDRGTYTIDI
jgi:hypothetical protein